MVEFCHTGPWASFAVAASVLLGITWKYYMGLGPFDICAAPHPCWLVGQMTTADAKILIT